MKTYGRAISLDDLTATELEQYKEKANYADVVPLKWVDDGTGFTEWTTCYKDKLKDKMDENAAKGEKTA